MQFRLDQSILALLNAVRCGWRAHTHTWLLTWLAGFVTSRYAKPGLSCDMLNTLNLSGPTTGLMPSPSDSLGGVRGSPVRNGASWVGGPRSWPSKLTGIKTTCGCARVCLQQLSGRFKSFSRDALAWRARRAASCAEHSTTVRM